MTQVVLLEWALLIGVVALVWTIERAVRGARLRRQRVYGDLARLTWRQFEQLIGDAFRRHGYRVEERGGNHADGGVDLVLRLGGEVTVVQAKHWRRNVVGVSLVRELYGVQRAMSAERAMLVALFGFSADAREFAAQVGVRLVDGEGLLRIIKTGPADAPLVLPTPEGPSAPTCPSCSAEMVKRTARQGERAGQAFWGCSTYPICRATVDALTAGR